MSKKAAAKPKDEATYEVRDIVLAKIRGYPAWPGQVCRVVLPRELRYITNANATILLCVCVHLGCRS